MRRKGLSGAEAETIIELSSILEKQIQKQIDTERERLLPIVRSMPLETVLGGGQKAFDWHFLRIKEPAFRKAVDFLLGEPPRKQVLKEGRLFWKDVPPDARQRKSQQTLLMVRRIRNNLFHGAKFWSPEYDNRPRDIQLLKSSLTVLRECIQLKDNVHMAFKYGAF